MHKYWVAFLLEVQKYLEYRADLVVYSLANIISPITGLAIWLVVEASTNLVLSKAELIQYFLLVGILEVVTVAWGRYNVERAINSGEFANYQIKPYGLLGQNFAENIAEKVYQVSAVVIIFGVGCWIFRDVVQIHALYKIGNVLLFLISAILALIINVTIDLMMGLGFIWFHDIEFVEAVNGLTKGLLSGTAIPLVFLPTYLQGVAEWLPYRYIISFPAELILGNLSINQIWFGFGMQVFWCVGIVILYKIVYKIALKSYQGYGV